MNHKEQLFSSEQRIKDRTRHTNKNKIFLITVASIAIILIVAAIVYVIQYRLNHASFENYSMYQYFSGLRVDYEGTLTLAYDGGVTNLAHDDIEIEADSTPIYYTNIDNQVFFPTSMELIIPRMRNTTYKINYFSQISIDKYEGQTLSYLKYRDSEYELENNFLYDGNNLYFLTYGATVEVKDETIKLSPLSYIIVDYKGDVEFYDHESDTYRIIESVETDVKATLEDCVINMSSDTIIYDNGSSRLLVKNYGSLPTYTGQN